VRQEVILLSLVKRLTDRWSGVFVIFVGGMFCIFRAMDSHHPPTLVEYLFPFVLVYLHLALAPVPWQWVGSLGGDSTSRISVPVGLFVAVAFNSAWIAVLVIVSHALQHPNMQPPLNWPVSFPPPPTRPRMMNPAWGLGLINLTFATVVGWVLAEKESMEVRERKTSELLRQSESKALQNQLDPHVLYNALSGLSELIHEDPLAAEEVITQLADLYRMLTHHGKRDLVNLGEERRLVEAYLAMEQMRLAERLRVTWTWPDWADAITVPPLFLQPLVENAIKHGIGPCDSGGDVLISCSRKEDRISLTVENTGATPPDSPDQGIGLGNLKARLVLWAGAEGTFSLTRNGAWSVAVLQWKTVGKT
jgi:two-component sensor histidine kinase